MLLVITACNSSTIEELPSNEEEQTAIGFNAKVQNSRAIADLNAVKNNGFKVWGGYDKNNVFQGDIVSYSKSEGEWGYTDVKYWVLDKTYNFYALHPGNLEDYLEDYPPGNLAEVEANPEGSFVIKNFDLQGNTSYAIDSENRIDLLRAAVLNRESSNTQAVNMQFTHMLTQIEVYALKEGANNNVTINEVKIYGIPAVATYTDLTTTWTTVTPTTDIAPFRKNASDITLSTTATNVWGEALWVAPVLDNNTVVSVTYTQNGSQKTKTMEPVAYGSWDPGKKYKYTITVIDDGNILFDTPKIVPWTNTNGSIIIVD